MDEGYFSFNNRSGSSRMNAGSEVQRKLELFNSLRSDYQNDRDIVATIVDLQASVLNQKNVESFGHNAEMNSLESGNNLRVNNNSLVQMVGSTNHDEAGTGNELKRKRMEHSTASELQPNPPGHQIVIPALTGQDPGMNTNNEVQSKLEFLNSLRSEYPNDRDIVAPIADIQASLMDQNNVGLFGENAEMNLLASGTNLGVNNNSLVQIVGNTNHDDDGTGNELKRQRMQHSTASEFQSNAPGHQIATPTFTRQDPRTLLQTENLPMLAVNHEELLRQHLYHQILLKQDLMKVQNENMQLKALIQKHRQQNYLGHQILQSAPQLKRFHGLQNDFQLRNLLQFQPTHRISHISSFPVGVCSRRVMKYLHHLRQRPQDNNIGYWRKLVSEYYAPSAKIRRCFSLYKNLNHNALPGFLHTGKERWKCDVCGSRSGIGFETIFEIFPRLFQINFGGDLVDENLFLEMPQESKLPSGSLILEYGKSVLETVYKQGRVVHEGKLRVLFSQDLKILSWEFCSLKHEEFLVRQQIKSQIAKLVEAAEDCQTVSMASTEDFQSNCNKFAAAGQQLSRSINLPLVNSLGLSNRYVRCLQISEVFNSIGDLVALSAQNKMGPLECLKYYAQEESSKATQTKETTDHFSTVRGQSTRESTLTTASFSPGSGSVDSRLLSDKALQAEREVTFSNSGKIVGPTGRMIKQEKWCLGDQITEIPITSRMHVPPSADYSHQGANNACAGGQMVVTSTAAVGSRRVAKGPHSSNSSSSPRLLEIKKEPPFF